jgi:hypothetical protein
MKCPTDKPCPFKVFSLHGGMECSRDKYPHLIVFCVENELKKFCEGK